MPSPVAAQYGIPVIGPVSDDPGRIGARQDRASHIGGVLAVKAVVLKPAVRTQVHAGSEISVKPIFGSVSGSLRRNSFRISGIRISLCRNSFPVSSRRVRYADGSVGLGRLGVLIRRVGECCFTPTDSVDQVRVTNRGRVRNDEECAALVIALRACAHHLHVRPTRRHRGVVDVCTRLVVNASHTIAELNVQSHHADTHIVTGDGLHPRRREERVTRRTIHHMAVGAAVRLKENALRTGSGFSDPQTLCALELICRGVFDCRTAVSAPGDG